MYSRYTTMDEIVFIRGMHYLTIWKTVENSYFVTTMHTNYNKISARERDSAPRFYYKRTQKITCIQRIKNFIRRLIAFFFSQIGICALVAGYMVMGAFLFEHLEAESQMEHAVSRNNFHYLILQLFPLRINTK